MRRTCFIEHDRAGLNVATPVRPPGAGDGGAAVAARKVEYLDAHDEMTVDLHGRGVRMPTLMVGERVHGGRR